MLIENFFTLINHCSVQKTKANLWKRLNHTSKRNALKKNFIKKSRPSSEDGFKEKGMQNLSPDKCR